MALEMVDSQDELAPDDRAAIVTPDATITLLDVLEAVAHIHRRHLSELIHEDSGLDLAVPVLLEVSETSVPIRRAYVSGDWASRSALWMHPGPGRLVEVDPSLAGLLQALADAPRLAADVGMEALDAGRLVEQVTAAATPCDPLRGL